MKLKIFFYISGASLVALFFFWLLFLNHVDINEIGVAYDSRTGKLSKQECGWHLTEPWVEATTIPTIPVRVEIYNHNRFILPKLVQFQPEYYKEFIEIEGFKYFIDIPVIFSQYAYSGKDWPFLKEVNLTK